MGKMNQKKKSLANQIGFNQTYQDPWRNGANLTYDEKTGQFLDKLLEMLLIQIRWELHKLKHLIHLKN